MKIFWGSSPTLSRFKTHKKFVRTNNDIIIVYEYGVLTLWMDRPFVCPPVQPSQLALRARFVRLPMNPKGRLKDNGER